MSTEERSVNQPEEQPSLSEQRLIRRAKLKELQDAGQDPFQYRSLRVMPIIFQTLAVELLLELVLYDGGSGNILFIAVHPCPLEWSKRLGDKKGGACGDLAFSISFLLGDLVISPGDLIRQPRNLFHIFFRLCRKAQHKI